ncbi:MAG: thiol-disulfide isomerase [Acidobacteria bacterium]|nr:MAG: thiol-disulfide isomerase [Acidobacteriota bacterium]
MFLLLFFSLALGYPAPAAGKMAWQAAALGAPRYVPVTRYDPKRDPQADLVKALAEAKRTGRRVLLEVGGDWCSWCHVMDKLFADHADVRALRERNFVTLKINMSPANENRAFLSRHHRIPGYPFLFVLDADGKLVHPQRANVFEDGDIYNVPSFAHFLTVYGPSPVPVNARALAEACLDE